MKVSFIRQGALPRCKDEFLWVVVAQFVGLKWGFADRFDLPYTATSCRKINNLMHAIRKEAAQLDPNWWTEQRFAICKIELDGKEKNDEEV